MPDWTATLELRQSGHAAGFLASNIPLEDQDEAYGGILVDTPEDETGRADEAVPVRAEESVPAATAAEKKAK